MGAHSVMVVRNTEAVVFPSFVLVNIMQVGRRGFGISRLLLLVTSVPPTCSPHGSGSYKYSQYTVKTLDYRELHAVGTLEWKSPKRIHVHRHSLLRTSR